MALKHVESTPYLFIRIAFGNLIYIVYVKLLIKMSIKIQKNPRGDVDTGFVVIFDDDVTAGD